MNIDALIADAKEFKVPVPELGTLTSEAAAQVTACYAAADWLESQGRHADAKEARRWGAIHNARFVRLWATAEAAL
jgi:hypothetical protein